MLKCKMIDSIGQSDYIAAGRTDKGVHAVNNVFSIIGKLQVKAYLQSEEFRLKFCRDSVTLSRF